ncbi:MAG: deaminase, partial [Candidatus Omnitrophota bacterium]
MYIISKKCISIVVLICFIINVTSSSKAYGLSISAPIIEDNLATASIFDDLKGAQHKDIANISLALQAYLLKYGTNLIDINSLKEAILFEDTVYSPAEMHFIFSGEGMKDINDKYASVKCKLKKGDRVEDYYVIFSKEKSNNGFHLEVLTEKEWQKYERAQLDTLPTRDSQKSKNAFGRDTGMVDTEIYPETEELEEELLCHMPGLIKRKHGHVQYVNKFAHKFYEKRFDELYETFRDKAVSEEDLPSKIEYMAVLEQLYAIYQGLSDEGKELLKVLTIFHDIGAIKEGRDWEHSILGSKFAIPILRQFNYSDAFIKKVVRLIGKHGFFSDMGVAFLPIDFSELSKEEKNILLLFSLFDGSARGDGSNRMKPWKIRLLKSFKNGLITRLRNSEKLYMYRLTNLLAPVTFAGEEGRKTQKRKIKKILARKGYATKSFMNNWNNLIRVYAFNMFTLNGEDSLEDFVDLTKAVSDTIDEYEKNHPEDDIKEVIVDTDIDFMGLPFPSQKYYATKFNELFKSGKKLPVTVSFSDGTLKIIMEVGKSFPTVSSLHITSLDPDSFAWNDENVVMNKILSIAEKDSRTGRKGLFIAGALVRDDGENLIASEVSVPEITGIYGHVGDHVEMIILKEAQRRGWDLSRCTLYVTLENCYNCAKAISNNFRPKKVIIGCEDDSQKGPNDLSVDGRGFTFLNAGGIPTKIIKNDALYERALNLMEKQDLWAQINRTEYEKARKDPEGTLKVIYNSNYLKDKEDYDDFLDWTVYWLVKNSDQFDSNEWQQVYAIDADKFVDEPGSILTEEAIQLILWGVLRINSSNDKYKLVLTGGAENCQKVADAVIKYTSERGRVEYEMITPERVFILPVSRGKSIKAGDIKPYEEKSSHTFQISKRIKDLIA